MSERQKQLLIVGVVIIVALILFMRSSNNNTVVQSNNGETVSLPNLQTPVINITPRQPFILPNLGLTSSANSLSAIGACCADCRPQTTSSYRSNNSGITFVTNMGNSGPNVFNYYQETPQQPSWNRAPSMRML